MKVLVLGGTLFLGRHLVNAALARGHDVTLFNRGRTNPELFPEVEKLRGDREVGDIDALRGRSWDAAIDTSGYLPRVVRESAALLADAAGHYSFVSSLSVFSPPSKHGLSEDDQVTTIPDETSENVQLSYGPLKALCERAVTDVFGDRALNLRPGILVGPHDPTNRFGYWVRRMSRGGNVLAPAPPDQPVQLIDARDFADWNIRMAETGRAGTFHATGKPSSFADMLAECEAVAGRHAHVVWVDERFLVQEGAKPFADLPLWLATDHNPAWSGFFLADVSKAVAHGLSFRPLRDTARDVLASQDPPTGVKFGVDVPPAGIPRAREAELLDAWKVRA